MPEHIGQNGIVVAAHGRRGIIEAGGRRLKLISPPRYRPVCGDHVRFEIRAGSVDAVVTGIHARKNVLARVGRSGSDKEILAANLTQVIVVCAPRPEPDWHLLDRYLCAAELMHCLAVVAWNKSDLRQFPARLDDYRNSGYPVLQVSAHTGENLDMLQNCMRNETSVFVGQSGTGKSSLINALVPQAEAATGELSQSTDAGTHTTTATLMYPVTPSGWLLDTPGVRSFLPAVDPTRIREGFPEMRELAAKCRFADCQHLHEPDCAVIQAVLDGRVSARRHSSYQQLLKSAQSLPRSWGQ